MANPHQHVREIGENCARKRDLAVRIAHSSTNTSAEIASPGGGGPLEDFRSVGESIKLNQVCSERKLAR